MQGIKGDLASLQRTLDGQINGMLSKMDGLAATQTVQHSAGQQQVFHTLHTFHLALYTLDALRFMCDAAGVQRFC